MINLIPRSAKKSIKHEYWVRVATVWLVLFSLALILGVGTLMPAYELINRQVEVYGSSAAEASQKLADYKNVSTGLVESSRQAKYIIDEKNVELISYYVSMFESLQGSGIELSQISLDRSEEGIAPVRVSGVAADRRALASFRDRLLEREEVKEVDLPISNLASDKAINFNITVTIANHPEV